MTADQISDFGERMGGEHIIMAKAVCDPIGTDPEKDQSFIKRMANRIKDFVEDIFQPGDQHEPTIDEKRARVRGELKAQRLKEESKPKYAGFSGASVGEDLQSRFHTGNEGDLEQLLNIYIR